MHIKPEADGMTVQNPFKDAPQQISRYSAEEVEVLQQRLDKQLGPEWISSRPGAGGKRVHYLASNKCFDIANDVFGFNGWCTSIREVQIDFVDENPTTGKISMGVAVTVRITLKDGAYHEDIGYGQISNCPDKAQAFEKTRKEAVSDAKKRTLRTFGNVLGNCVYDKDYLARITKVKVGAPKFNVDNLYRHSEYIANKKEPPQPMPSTRASIDNDATIVAPDMEDDFGGADFDDADFSVPISGHPDEVAIDTHSVQGHRAPSPTKQQNNVPSNNNTAGQRQQPQNPQSMRPPQPQQSMPPGPMNAGGGRPSLGPAPNMRPVQTPNGQLQRPSVAGHPQQPPHVRPQSGVAQNLAQSGGGTHAPQGPPRQTPPDGPLAATTRDAVKLEGEAPVGFLSARGLQEGKTKAPIFDPRAESPSIRRTSGVDHTSSKPLTKQLNVAPPASTQSEAPSKSNNFVNPQLDPSRRVGMPGGVASPLHNRSTFRQPQMKRPADGPVPFKGRPALNDVTSNTINTPIDNGGDAKRQRVNGGAGQVNDGGALVGQI